jgi:hypothetical protein
MRHQIFVHYNNLTLKDKVEPIKCMVSSHTTHMIPAFDFDKEETYYYCVECDYKITPGLEMYNQLVERINVADPYPDFPEETK